MSRDPKTGLSPDATAFAAARKALVAKIQPLYAQITDPAQQVGFVLAMGPPNGPKIMAGHDARGLYLTDFNLPVDQFNHYAQLAWDPATGLPYSYTGPNLLPKDKFDALVKQALSYGA